MTRHRFALLIAIVFVALVLHIRLGKHRVVVKNDRSVPIRSVEIRVRGERVVTSEIPIGGLSHSAFRNPWPAEAAVALRVEDQSGTVAQHECLYLGILPEVALVRLGDEGVECRRLGSVLLSPLR